MNDKIIIGIYHTLDSGDSGYHESISKLNLTEGFIKEFDFEGNYSNCLRNGEGKE